jgi:predicted component of type VI protein secretion system
MATNPVPTIPQTRAAAQTLENQLANANPIGADASATVADALEAVGVVLTALNQEEAAQRSGQMQAVGQDVTDAVKQLTALKKQLAQIGSDIGIVGDVAGGLDALLTGCGSIFKI